jgi:type I restriction enzyme S subunit
MSDIIETELGQIIKLGNGKIKPTQEGNIPIYGGNGVLGYCSKSNYTGNVIIIGRVGAYCGSVYYSKNPVWVSDNALAANPKDDNNSKYLYYLLKQLNLNNYAEGSSHPLVTQGLINAIEVKYHKNPEEQQAIAEVLSSLDDKIDLLHRNNKTLEEMAETLFRQWFDIEENEENYCRLGSVIKTTSGGTPSRNQSSYYGGNIPWVKSKELSGGFITKTEEHLSEEGLKKSSAKLLPEYSVLLAMYGATVGEICVIPFQATCNQAICALLPSATYPYTWIHNFLKFKKDDIINLATGAAQQNISQIIIHDLLVPKPSEKISTFHQIVNVLYEKILNNTQQIEQLKATRDSLLPKLMSGQVRVNI